MKSRDAYSSYLFIAFVTLVMCIVPQGRASAMTTVFMNYTNFSVRLGQLAANAGITPFDAAEEAMMKSQITSSLETVFDGFTIDFSDTNPGGAFPTLSFGLTAGPGALGQADHIDYRNKQTVDLARIFSANFDFIVENSDPRASQISELSFALAGTGAHELGHNFGLRHHDSYGDASIVYTGSPINTGGIQNTHVMATGSTGQNEAGFESVLTFSEHSLVKLSFAEELSSTVPTTITEGADFGDSAGAATPLAFTNLANVDRSAVNVAGQINNNTDADVFSFTLEAGTRFSADINIDYPNSISFNNVDTFMELVDSDGTTVLASDDVTKYSGNNLGAGGSGDGFDPWLVNVPIADAGTYYLRITPETPDAGDYELLIHTDLQSNVIGPDFNDDGLLNCDDIDPLVAAIAAGANDPTFDLTGDGFVDLEDRDSWLTQAGAENLDSGNPYLLGDATLDGTVDGFDFIEWNANKFTATPEWCSGDFNADGFVDGFDFVVWNGNKFTEADQGSALSDTGPVENSMGELIHLAGPSAVPEPSGWIALLAAMGGWGLFRRY